jgi:hypothetical protein
MFSCSLVHREHQETRAASVAATNKLTHIPPERYASVGTSDLVHSAAETQGHDKTTDQCWSSSTSVFLQMSEAAFRPMAWH